MSLDKAIKHGKDHRKGYRERGKPGEYDRTCRPGAKHRAMVCRYCERNRLFSSLRRVDAVDALQDNGIEYHLWNVDSYNVRRGHWSGDSYREIDWLFDTIGSDCTFDDYVLYSECIKC